MSHATLSHSASTQNNSHWPSVRALVRLILIESGCWSKEQTFTVAACGVCPKRMRSERLNETVSFYAPFCAFRGARRHLGSFASFELFDHDGPVGIELHCSRRSPSKLTISFNLSEPIFS